MALSSLIEFLATLERPGGGVIAEPNLDQTIAPAVMPGQILGLDYPPPQGTFAYVVYRMSWHGLVPNVFTLNLLKGGSPIFDVVMTQNITLDALDCFFIASASSPLRLEVENISGIQQYYEHLFLLLTIPTNEDLQKVKEAIQIRYGVTEWSWSSMRRTVPMPPGVRR